MKASVLQYQARVLIPGQLSGDALVLGDTLSFWGGFNPENGEIIDVHHPQYRQRVGGRILCIPQSRGSAGTPGGIAETLRNGSGPLAFILGEADVNIAVGSLVANRLYDMKVPVFELALERLKQLQNGDRLQLAENGLISVHRS